MLNCTYDMQKGASDNVTIYNSKLCKMYAYEYFCEKNDKYEMVTVR